MVFYDIPLNRPIYRSLQRGYPAVQARRFQPVFFPSGTPLLNLVYGDPKLPKD
jgi:hypothetical protein